MEMKQNGISSSVEFPMKGGDSAYNYAKNSVGQRAVANFTEQIMNKEIIEKLDLGLIPPKTFYIADLGCSVGPNTFYAVENIIGALESKYENPATNKTLEFQVFFNDHASNDFNALFKSLPQNRRYHAAGVPGSFYNRLFPDASLHLVYSSISIHWLSRVPKEVVDKNSPAWNKGRVYYSDSGDEVIRAYKAQHEEDMEKFLQARAQEVVSGGLLVLMSLSIHDGINNPSEAGVNRTFSLIGSCLMDLAKKGIVSQDKVDSFNIPIYVPTPLDLEAAVKRNGSFGLERMEVLPNVLKAQGLTINAQQLTYSVRSTLEDLIEKEFGKEIVAELFDLYRKKIEELSTAYIIESEKSSSFLVVLKRKPSQYIQ